MNRTASEAVLGTGPLQLTGSSGTVSCISSNARAGARTAEMPSVVMGVFIVFCTDVQRKYQLDGVVCRFCNHRLFNGNDISSMCERERDSLFNSKTIH